MRVAQTILEHLARGIVQLPALAAALGTPRKNVGSALQQLKRRGLVDSPARGCYALTDAGHAWLASGRIIAAGQSSCRPRTVTRGLRQRCWWVLRARKSATLPELLSALADGSERDATGNLRRYLQALVEAGFVAVAPQRVAGSALRSNGYLRYTLVRDNGRLAPVVRLASGTVYDPNSGVEFGGEAQP